MTREQLIDIAIDTWSDTEMDLQIDEIYISMYCTGSYEDYNEEIIGISSTRKVAESYATRLADELNEEARKTGWLEPGSIQIRELDGEKYKPEKNTVVMYRRDYKKRRMLKDE